MATKIEVEIPIERQKAAQAAGNFGLEDLPPQIAEPDAAVRLGKTAKSDEGLVRLKAAKSLVTLSPGQLVANFGKSEAKWALTYNKKRAGTAKPYELLSYARQLIGLDETGQLLICLMGHAGQGPCVPLWVPRDEVTLTTQPNDILLRFDEIPSGMAFEL